MKKPNTSQNQWAALSRNDWSEILILLEKKAFQRKAQIIETFTALVAKKGFHRVTHLELAKSCKVSRPLIVHHFPKDEDLVALCFRYIYARFQKLAADAMLSRAGFKQQLGAYIEAVAMWADTHQNDARFLVQFYALLQVSPEFLALHERNIDIGRKRITALCMKAKKEEGFFNSVSESELHDRTYSVQKQLLGYIVLHSPPRSEPTKKEDREELRRAIFSILGLT